MMQKIMPARTGWLAAAFFLSVSAAAAQPVKTVVLQGGTLIDGTGKAPIANAVVVVRGDRITAVGPRGRVAIPAGARVINTSGRTILPGLIEGHVHSFDWQAPMFLHYGVTTISDFDSDTAWILAQREMYNNGRIKGPRIFVAGAKLWGPLVPGPVGRINIARNVDEELAYFRSIEALGVDYLKIDDTLTYPQLQAAIDEGKRTGLKVLAHVQNIRLAGQMGIKFAEHFWSVWNALLDPDGKKYGAFQGRISYPKDSVGLPAVASETLVNPADFPPLIDFMVKNGIVFNPTMLGAWGGSTPVGREYFTETARLAKDPELAWVPEEGRSSWASLASREPARPQAEYNVAARFLREFAQAGGKVITGSEGTSGLSTHYEMYMLVEAGVTPMQAIQGATLWNAEKIGKEKDLGSVEVGKFGDFTIIEGDPLKDIKATMNVRMVIKGGEVLDTKYDPNWKNPIPRPYTSAPNINWVSPLSARQDGPPVTLELIGTGFRPDSIIRFDTVDLPTQFVSSTKLTATIGSALLNKVGESVIYVLNPGQVHGQISPPKYFLVNFKN